MIAHPLAMAAWFGLLATCLNLLPIWQLDGGHIAYAMFGRTAQRNLSIVTIAALFLISFFGWPPSITLLVFSSLVLLIGFRTKFFHPQPLIENEPLGSGRFFLGLIAFLILLISFTRVPVTIT
jgi:membrane-associated protease RseP (regulator of RpoE activity)